MVAVLRSRWPQPVEVRTPSGWTARVAPDECITVPADVYQQTEWPAEQWAVLEEPRGSL